MPCRRHRTWHPTQSQYTDKGLTCRCAIHWCGTSHWNTQLPTLMSWVRPNWEILLWPNTQANAQFYDAGMVVVSQKLSRKCTLPTGSGYRDLWCANPLRYPLAHSCFYDSNFILLHNMLNAESVQIVLNIKELLMYGPTNHLRSPRLSCVRSLGSPWYDYVYFNSASSSIQWVVSLLQWLTKLSVLNMFHYATMNNKTSVKHNWRCFKSWSVIGRIESVRVQSD